jgi:signal transduction histidine kinase
MDKTISNTNKDLKIAENNLRYLAKASAVLAASLDYKKTLQSIAKLMVPDIADWCGIDILDDQGQLQSVAVAHKDPDKVRWARELREKQGPQDMNDKRGGPQVLRTGKPMFFPKLNDLIIKTMVQDEEELRLIREIGLSSIIIVPLRIEEKNVGTISLIRTDGRYYTNSDLEMAIELANRASLAMTNASLYLSAQQELNHRIRLEEALRDANEELENRVKLRTAELANTNINLERSNQELEDFAYVASHDLQEPLRKIQAFGNLLETEYGDRLGEGVEYVKRMQNAARRMSALIEDILSFSRITTKGREFTNVKLREVVQEVLGDLEMRIADTKATIEIGNLPTIHADAMQMRQLLQNLIANALKFHKPGKPPVIKIKSTVISGLEDKSKFCKLEVADNGIGFDEKYADRAFAVFQRLHARENYEGTGIGLAICRKIAERHGGLIMVKSKQGKGSTFIVTLPMKHKKGEILL